MPDNVFLFTDELPEEVIPDSDDQPKGSGQNAMIEDQLRQNPGKWAFIYGTYTKDSGEEVKGFIPEGALRATWDRWRKKAGFDVSPLKKMPGSTGAATGSGGRTKNARYAFWIKWVGVPEGEVPAVIRGVTAGTRPTTPLVPRPEEINPNLGEPDEPDSELPAWDPFAEELPPAEDTVEEPLPAPAVPTPPTPPPLPPVPPGAPRTGFQKVHGMSGGSPGGTGSGLG